MNISDDTMQALEEIAKDYKVSIEEALKFSVACGLKITKARQDKCTIVLLYPGGREVRELDFRFPKPS